VVSHLVLLVDIRGSPHRQRLFALIEIDVFGGRVGIVEEVEVLFVGQLLRQGAVDLSTLLIRGVQLELSTVLG